MLKNGDKDLSGSDIEGRVMAIEQNTRGLNARVCAIEKSLSIDQRAGNVRTGILQPTIDQQITDKDQIDDFVPAMREIRIDQNGDMSNGRETRIMEAEKPVTITGIEKIPRSMVLPLDVTGLLAGALLILISILLFTDNIGLLKNPLVPLLFGTLLIVCVLVKLCLK